MSSNQRNTIFEPSKPSVPANWDIVPFEKGAVVVSDKGKRIKQKSYLETGSIPIIDQGQDYFGGYTNDATMVFDGNLPVVLFGDHTRAIKYVDKSFAVGAEGIKILKPAEFYEPKFFYYLLKSLHIPSRGYSRHFQFLKKFFLLVAPPNEQKHIVAEIEKQFSRLDKSVAALKKIKANLKRYKASVLKAAVEGRLTEEWRKEHPDVEPASELLKRILTERRMKWEEAELGKMKAKGKEPKDDQWKKKYEEPETPDISALTDIPATWTWTRVGDVYNIVGGGTPSTKIPEYWNGNIPWITSADIRGITDIKPKKLVTKKGIENSATNLVPENSIIVVTRVGLGKVALARVPLCFSQDSQGLVNSSSFISPGFAVFYLLKAVQIFKYQHRGTTIAGVTKKQLAELPFALPPLLEQHQIDEEIERRFSLTEEIEADVESNFKRAERLRQSILKKAFSGKLVLQDAADKP